MAYVGFRIWGWGAPGSKLSAVGHKVGVSQKKKQGTFLGVPIIRTILFLGLYWSPPILGNRQACLGSKGSSGFRR